MAGNDKKEKKKQTGLASLIKPKSKRKPGELPKKPKGKEKKFPDSYYNPEYDDA